MKNNSIGKITMTGSKRKRSLFNLSHDSNTTFGFGECQPLICHPMLADSKMVVGLESRVLLAAMNVPTFGRLKLKTYSQFVPAVDIYDCFNELMAGTRFTYGYQSYVPKRVPSMWLGLLSSMCLAGADCSIYFNATSGSKEGWICPTYSEYQANYAAAFNAEFPNAFDSNYTFNNEWFTGKTFAALDLKCCLGDNFLTYQSGVLFGHKIPIAAIAFADLLAKGSSGSMYPEVNMAEADYVVQRQFDYNGTNYRVAFAFRLNAFGKRIRKMLIGAGYQINLNSLAQVSLLPLMACYKAYFDLFNLPQWTNFEDTYLRKFIVQYLADPLTSVISSSTQHFQIFTQWMTEVGSAWYTSPQDYVSAHTTNTKAATSTFGLNNFYDVSNVSVGSGSDGGFPYAADGHVDATYVNNEGTSSNPDARITNPIHSQLDSELLKRLYKWTNRNSVIGQRVAELLRAQGLGEYVDECKSNYIGSWDVSLNLGMVVSQTDSYQPATESGKTLGAYGGKGIGYDNMEKPLVYETKEFGFWVTLAVVVPDSGYGQTLDPSIYSIEKESFYNPEFDALGVEASPKLNVVASEAITTPRDSVYTDGSLDQGFGYVPRYTGLKVINNKQNGDFSLHSLKESYPPFCLDKMIYVNEMENASISELSSGVLVGFDKPTFTPSQLPVAGNVWRYPTRYGWLGNFDRMFALVGLNNRNKYSVWTDIQQEVYVPQYDNFLCQSIFNIRYYAPMLPIEDSYETHEDGNEGPTTSAVSKA